MTCQVVVDDDEPARTNASMRTFSSVFTSTANPNECSLSFSGLLRLKRTLSAHQPLAVASIDGPSAGTALL